jgi:hypothetical protein
MGCAGSIGSIGTRRLGLARGANWRRRTQPPSRAGLAHGADRLTRGHGGAWAHTVRSPGRLTRSLARSLGLGDGQMGPSP